MGILEFFFKDAVRKKECPLKPLCLQTKRCMEISNPQQAVIKQKEEELLNKIRTGIEESRKNREEYKFSVSKIVKLTKEGILKLEEKIYTEQSSSVHTAQKDTSKDFYNQYAMGQFVVSL